ncbi:MAG TPA: addiction module protein [Burkholderiaceae bacterium]|nr:addiction module protein [Rhodoferax sp.]HQZ07737.1 addiction module protein [Burkholderiaceae bacterium]
MPIPFDTLEAEVLKLPAGARSHLLDRLIASLGTDAAIEEAWALEAERRDAEVDEGKVATLPGTEVQTPVSRIMLRTGQLRR